jgi:hypothetical protein
MTKTDLALVLSLLGLLATLHLGSTLLFVALVSFLAGRAMS